MDDEPITDYDVVLADNLSEYVKDGNRMTKGGDASDRKP